MLPDHRPLRIGSRTSAMAVSMARTAAEAITDAADVPVDLVGIRTTGDQWKGDLAEIGGKGAFLKQIEQALVAGEIDIAVHAMKDVPGDVDAPEDIGFAAYLARTDVRDVLIARPGFPCTSLARMPPGTRIGTSAVRRRAQLLQHRPDVRVGRVRGNADERIARMDEHAEVDALVLNRSGLDHVGLAGRVSDVLPTEVMCPPVGAGVVGLQCRTADTAIRDLLRLVDDPQTRIHVTAERAMLRALRGHCNSPIAGHARSADRQLDLVGMVFTSDGAGFLSTHHRAAADNPAALGAGVAADLLEKGARAIIDASAY
ncbi:hydroxymethylbilane synthase [Streptomonospora wellingtoniae]|uniref:Hydroxymethylbilane synthase n=1 Tax=Streptomonospora wellingtoniae TaxID=3075544 RepID=A0ABU2KYC0_9ACTN|nr:hydroxymethylbilane synthase [Streptomonospora sp. DSM 45055]MDT0304309.1 hydroxymethylbilane synthase [Streptomonospora sp. DSM 45055]